MVLPTSAFAQVDKYQITPEEHAACDSDVYRLCSDSQDQDQVLACMRVHKSELTPKCKIAFSAGLKKRHLQHL